MAKYWSKDAIFTHPVFQTYNREDAWGIYQLWSCNHLPPGLKIEYLEIFFDKAHNSVLLDTLNHARVFWWPPFRQHVELHTILDLADTPHGKARICDRLLALATLPAEPAQHATGPRLLSCMVRWSLQQLNDT
jgi:hypothetical protein